MRFRRDPMSVTHRLPTGMADYACPREGAGAALIRPTTILIFGPRAYVGPDRVDVHVGDHAGPRRHLPLAVPDHGVEARALVGTQQLEVGRRAGCHQPFAMTLRATLRVDLAAGIGGGLGWRGRDMSQHGGDDKKTDAQ